MTAFWTSRHPPNSCLHAFHHGDRVWWYWFWPPHKPWTILDIDIDVEGARRYREVWIRIGWLMARVFQKGRG
jgi:hypothetical protein